MMNATFMSSVRNQLESQNDKKRRGSLEISGSVVLCNKVYVQLHEAVRTCTGSTMMSVLVISKWSSSSTSMVAAWTNSVSSIQQNQTSTI